MYATLSAPYPTSNTKNSTHNIYKKTICTNTLRNFHLYICKIFFVWCKNKDKSTLELPKTINFDEEKEPEQLAPIRSAQVQHFHFLHSKYF